MTYRGLFYFVYEPVSGMDLRAALLECHLLASENDCEVMIKFNNVEYFVSRYESIDKQEKRILFLLKEGEQRDERF